MTSGLSLLQATAVRSSGLTARELIRISNSEVEDDGCAFADWSRTSANAKAKTKLSRKAQFRYIASLFKFEINHKAFALSGLSLSGCVTKRRIRSKFF